MARSHGKILSDIWIDPEWLDLDPLAQWAYEMLLSQPRLSLVGSIDYEPHRWAQLASGLSQDDLVAALGRLEAAGFVCIDYSTRELLVRSMTRHDGLRTNNPKLLKGLWGHWKGIASAGLRKVAVDNMPDTLFDHSETPDAAERLRRSERMDWAIGCATDRPIGHPTDRANGPPSAFHRPPSADTQSVTQSVQPVDNVDFEHHPAALIPEDCRSVARSELPSVRAALFKGNPAKNGERHAVQVSGALTNSSETT